MNKTITAGSMPILPLEQLESFYSELHTALSAGRTNFGAREGEKATMSINHLKVLMRDAIASTENAEVLISSALDRINAKIVGLGQNGDFMFEFKSWFIR